MNETDKTKLKAIKKTHKRAKIKVSRDAEKLGLVSKQDSELTLEEIESRQFVAQMTKAYVGSIEFYKSEMGGYKTHKEAVKHQLDVNEFRRGQVEQRLTHQIDWSDISAIVDEKLEDGHRLWLRIREDAADDLAIGIRAAKIVDRNASPKQLAEFLAIREAFITEWQPRGGIEMAMIDMLVVAFSLFMFWSEIANQRGSEIHDDQKSKLEKYECNGWKSPYQYKADAVDQAYKLADSYNRQFLRVLRQLRDLRRYSPVVIQNNGGQVNVGNQQVNVKE